MRNKHPDARTIPSPSDEVLKSWLEAQRYQYQLKIRGEETNMSDERKAKLESLGFALFPRQELWEDKYRQLVEFVKRRGCFPYELDVEDLNDEERKLFYWCQKQKKAHNVYRRARPREPTNMTPEREAKLEAIGFCFNSKEAKWDSQYQELKDYYDRHGDCLVPSDFPANQQLATWVGEQRTHYKRFRQGKASSMTSRRFELLSKLDFSWDARETRWLRRYKELKNYVALNGFGCRPHYKKQRALSTWLQNQQTMYRALEEGEKTTLTEQRVQLLKKLGFLY